MSIQRELQECREALAILAQKYAGEVGEPSLWRGLMKTCMEQAKENLEHESAQLDRLYTFALDTKVAVDGYDVPCLRLYGVSK